MRYKPPLPQETIPEDDTRLVALFDHVTAFAKPNATLARTFPRLHDAVSNLQSIYDNRQEQQKGKNHAISAADFQQTASIDTTIVSILGAANSYARGYLEYRTESSDDRKERRLRKNLITCLAELTAHLGEHRGELVAKEIVSYIDAKLAEIVTTRTSRSME